MNVKLSEYKVHTLVNKDNHCFTEATHIIKVAENYEIQTIKTTNTKTKIKQKTKTYQ